MNMNDIWLNEPNSCDYSEESFRYINTVSSEAKSIFLYMLEIGRMKEKKSRRIENENLNSFFFGIILDGKGTMTYKEHTFHLNAGSCVFIDCLEPHSYQSDKNNPWDMMFIHFAGGSSEEYYKLFDSTYVNAVRPDSIEPFKNILERIAEININSEPYTELITSKLITDLLTMLITFRYNEHDSNSKTLSTIKSIKEYIDENFTGEIYLDVLSEKFGINKFNITKEFKRTFGITISKYILFKRLSYSKHLLRFSDKSIEEISEICGFYDTSYFNKQFKASEDITPLKYRKSWTVR